jgi:hypothetical protein
MKKFYLCIVLSVSLFAFTSKAFTKEMLSGITMEEADESSWSTSKLNQSDGNTVTYTFGYTNDKPGKIIRDVQVINLLGQKVFSKDNISSDDVTINLSFLMEGIYYTKITDTTDKSFIKT